MIDPVTRWFKTPQYDDKRVISIANFIETTWLTRYPRGKEITYDQISKLIVIEFIKYLIEIEYGIIAKQSTSGNPTSNVILERIHQVLGNLVRNHNIK